jgi:hypothetical protein
MKQNKINRIATTDKVPTPKKFSRVDKLLRWTQVLIGFPMTYIIFPISCCVRNPAAHVLYDYNDTAPLENRCVENVMVGCVGATMCACCCGCFCGYCGNLDVKDFDEM